jgi:hypothetical protein
LRQAAAQEAMVEARLAESCELLGQDGHEVHGAFAARERVAELLRRAERGRARGEDAQVRKLVRGDLEDAARVRELVHFVEHDDTLRHGAEERDRIDRGGTHDLRQVAVEEGRGPKRAREGGFAHAPNAREPTDRRALPGPIEAIGPKRTGIHFRSHGPERSGLRPNVKRFLHLDRPHVKTAYGSASGARRGVGGGQPLRA